MQLSSKYGFAFLCMPKCASTSVESAIEEYCDISCSVYPGLKHINARLFKNYILALHNKVAPHRKIDTFCLMREPIDWLHSWYRYRQRNNLSNPNHPHHTNYTGSMSFDDFVQAYLDEENRLPCANVSSQINFIKLKGGKLGVDRLFSVERLDLVSNYLTEKIGKPIAIPELNKSNIKSNFELSPSLEEKLISYFEDDYALYRRLLEYGQLIL